VDSLGKESLSSARTELEAGDGVTARSPPGRPNPADERGSARVARRVLPDNAKKIINDAAGFRPSVNPNTHQAKQVEEVIDVPTDERLSGSRCVR